MSLYNITDTTRQIAHGMILCTCFMMPMQTIAYVTSKGILRGGGDTRFLLAADSSLVWLVSLPLGALAGLCLASESGVDLLFPAGGVPSEGAGVSAPVLHGKVDQGHPERSGKVVTRLTRFYFSKEESCREILCSFPSEFREVLRRQGLG